MLLLSHNWALLPELPSYIYVLTVGPILLFLFLNVSTFSNINVGFKDKYSILAFFMIIVSIVSIARFDIATMYNVVILNSTMYIILKNKLFVDLKLLNMIFLISVLFAIFSYHTGLNLYGYLPQHGYNEQYKMRISLFPLSVVGSAMISFVVLLQNYFSKKTKIRWYYILVSSYFILFSSNRTIIFGAFFFLLMLFATKTIKFKDRRFYRILPIVIFGLFLLLIFKSDSLIRLFWNAKTNNQITEQLITRDYDIDSELSGSARGFLMLSQFNLYLESPLIGLGTYKLSNIYDLTGNETYLTGLLARIGLLIIPFIVFFIILFKESRREQNIGKYVFLFAFFVIMVTYGVVIVPYDLIFLLFVGSFNIKQYNADKNEYLIDSI